MSLEELINKKNGYVKMPNTKYAISFEAIEKIYKRIAPFLKERQKKGIREGETDANYRY